MKGYRIMVKKSVMKLLASVLMVLCAHSSWAISVVGDDAYPPYSFKEKGKVTGIYTDIIRQALANMKDTSSIVAMPWKRGLSGLENKTIDSLFPPYYRPEQRPYMSYSTDILNETLVIFCNSKVSARLSSFPDDYKGISLGKNAGFAPGAAVEEAVKNKVIKLYEAKGMTANLKKLISNRINCYVNDRLSILYELKKMAGRGEYDGSSIVETHVLGIEKGYLAIHKDAGAEAKGFIENFNREIEGMKSSGKIDEIIAKYTQ
jgi:polar amino acid transport system substrate-binding protein